MQRYIVVKSPYDTPNTTGHTPQVGSCPVWFVWDAQEAMIAYVPAKSVFNIPQIEACYSWIARKQITQHVPYDKTEWADQT